MRMALLAEAPELPRTVIDADVLKTAVAGTPARVALRFFDAHGNLASPGEAFRVYAGDSQEPKRKVTDVKPSESLEVVWGEHGSGEATLSFVPVHAGNQELHVWADMGEHVGRVALPGSPFPMHVSAGQPTPSESYVESYTKDVKVAEERRGSVGGKGGKGKAAGPESGNDDRVTAGDVVTIRPVLLDALLA